MQIPLFTDASGKDGSITPLFQVVPTEILTTISSNQPEFSPPLTINTNDLATNSKEAYSLYQLSNYQIKLSDSKPQPTNPYSYKNILLNQSKKSTQLLITNSNELRSFPKRVRTTNNCTTNSNSKLKTNGNKHKNQNYSNNSNLSTRFCSHKNHRIEASNPLCLHQNNNKYSNSATLHQELINYIPTKSSHPRPKPRSPLAQITKKLTNERLWESKSYYPTTSTIQINLPTVFSLIHINTNFVFFKLLFIGILYILSYNLSNSTLNTFSFIHTKVTNAPSNYLSICPTLQRDCYPATNNLQFKPFNGSIFQQIPIRQKLNQKIPGKNPISLSQPTMISPRMSISNLKINPMLPSYGYTCLSIKLLKYPKPISKSMQKFNVPHIIQVKTTSPSHPSPCYLHATIHIQRSHHANASHSVYPHNLLISGLTLPSLITLDKPAPPMLVMLAPPIPDLQPLLTANFWKKSRSRKLPASLTLDP